MRFFVDFHCTGLDSWPLSERARFVYFNEAGPALHSEEAQAEKPTTEPEVPTGPVSEMGPQSFDDIAKPFHAKFDEFKRAAEESTGGRMALGVRMTSMSAIGDQMRVLGRFTEIENGYRERVRGLQESSPAYQEAVQTAQVELDDLMAKMDARMQEMSEGGDDTSETDEIIDAPTPTFTLKLHEPLTTDPSKYNVIMMNNVRTVQNELVNYLNANRELVLAKAVKGWKEPAKTERLQKLNTQIDEFIQNIESATNEMLRVLGSTSSLSIDEQKEALLGPAGKLGALLSSNRGVMHSFIHYELNEGFSEISDKILLGTDGGFLSGGREVRHPMASETTEETEDVEAYIPEFQLNLKKVPKAPPSKFNEVLIKNVKDTEVKFIQYLESNRSSVVERGARAISANSKEYEANKAKFNSRIDEYINGLKQSLKAVIRKLETVKEKPIKDQKEILKRPIRALQDVIARNFGFMQTFVPYKLTGGLREIDEGIMKPLQLPRGFF